jgi:hypothetical protein
VPHFSLILREVGFSGAVKMKSLRRIGGFIASVSLAIACFAGDTWVLRDDGVGPVKIGMTVTQLGATLHRKVEEDDSGSYSGSDTCYYVHEVGRNHVHYMIIDDRVVRIDVEERGIPTVTGIEVGDSEARVRRVYGSKMKVMAHQYIDTGHYLTVRSPDGRHGIRFETDNGKIIEFYAGTYEAIQYVEGCL